MSRPHVAKHALSRHSGGEQMAARVWCDGPSPPHRRVVVRLPPEANMCRISGGHPDSSPQSTEKSTTVKHACPVTLHLAPCARPLSIVHLFYFHTRLPSTRLPAVAVSGPSTCYPCHSGPTRSPPHSPAPPTRPSTSRTRVSGKSGNRPHCAAHPSNRRFRQKRQPCHTHGCSPCGRRLSPRWTLPVLSCWDSPRRLRREAAMLPLLLPLCPLRPLCCIFDFRQKRQPRTRVLSTADIADNPRKPA
jgi:hypothetical protein